LKDTAVIGRVQEHTRGCSSMPCSVSEALNREGTLSVPHTLLANNNSDEDLRVPVINMQKVVHPLAFARGLLA